MDLSRGTVMTYASKIHKLYIHTYSRGELKSREVVQYKYIKNCIKYMIEQLNK